MRGPRVRAVYRGLVGELERYVVMALLATDLALAEAPGNVLPGKKESGLSRDSVIVVPQVGAIDRRRLGDPRETRCDGCVHPARSSLKSLLPDRQHPVFEATQNLGVRSVLPMP